MMSHDLIARTCGYLSVFLSLIGLGILGEPKFVVTPQQHFAKLTLTIEMHNTSLDATTAYNTVEPATSSANTTPTPKTDSRANFAATPDSSTMETSSESASIAIALAAQHATSSPKSTSELKSSSNNTDPMSVPKTVPLDNPSAINAPPTTTIKTNAEPVKRPNKTDTIAKQQPPKQTAAKSAKNKQTKHPQSKQQHASASNSKKSQATSNNNKHNATIKVESATTVHTTKASKHTADPQIDPQLRSNLSSILVREIRSNLQYPRNAVRRKLEGMVMMEFTIKNGIVTSFRMRLSSGHKILDEAACKLAQKMVHFDTHLGQINYKVQIPIKYELL